MSCYFVLGPGRCGTSTVARILHTEFNVSMGQKFRESSGSNPQGYWEDLDFKDLNGKVILGHTTWSEWEIRIKNLIKQRNKDDEHWGMKDPHLCYLLGSYLHYVDSPILVRCIRNSEKVIDSICTTYLWSRMNATKMVMERESCLNKILKHFNPIVIDFNRKRSDDEIINQLGGLNANCSSHKNQDIAEA